MRLDGAYWCRVHICRLEIYLPFMSTFIHTVNSRASVQITGSDAVLIAYFAI